MHRMNKHEKNVSQIEEKILLSTASMKLAVRLSSFSSTDWNHLLQSSFCRNAH